MWPQGTWLALARSPTREVRWAGRVQDRGPDASTQSISNVAHTRFALTGRIPGRLSHEEYVTGSAARSVTYRILFRMAWQRVTFDVPAEPVELTQKGCMYLAARDRASSQSSNSHRNMTAQHQHHAVPVNNRGVE